jgi:hypothetical protein
MPEKGAEELLPSPARLYFKTAGLGRLPAATLFMSANLNPGQTGGAVATHATYLLAADRGLEPFSPRPSITM